MKRLFSTGIILFAFIHSIAQPQFTEFYPDTLNKKRLNTVMMVGAGSYLSGLSLLSFVWYKDHDRAPMHFYKDFKGYKQMDKAGHAFGAYHESFAAYYALRWAGLDKKRALIFGAPAGIIFQTPIEILDGIHDGWGFSWSDMAANTLGSMFFASQELLFDEQIILMKFSYSPSGYPKYHTILGVNHFENFFLDYNAHTYWLSANLNRLSGIEKIPKWLNIAFGYSANGMIKTFENPEYYNGEPFPHLERYRQYIFSLDIDLSKIRTKKPWLKSLFRALNILKIPFPALEYNRIDKFKFRPLYF